MICEQSKTLITIDCCSNLSSLDSLASSINASSIIHLGAISRQDQQDLASFIKQKKFLSTDTFVAPFNSDQVKVSLIPNLHILDHFTIITSGQSKIRVFLCPVIKIESFHKFINSIASMSDFNGTSIWVDLNNLGQELAFSLRIAAFMNFDCLIGNNNDSFSRVEIARNHDIFYDLLNTYLKEYCLLI